VNLLTPLHLGPNDTDYQWPTKDYTLRNEIENLVPGRWCYPPPLRTPTRSGGLRDDQRMLSHDASPAMGR